MQYMPYGDADVLDLFAWAYLQSLKERVGFAPGARVLSEAVGEVDGDVLTVALGEAWDWVKGYLTFHRRRAELEEEGLVERLDDAVLRLWAEKTEGV